MERENPFFNYNIPSFCFLERAKKQLNNFDAGSVEGLFYAALDLRFGIEAKLFESIEAASRDLKEPLKHSKEYVATRLLKILSEISPDYDKPCTVGFGLTRNSIRSWLHYTPVTKTLAQFHGMLGEMLHFKFFKNNGNWFVKQRLSNIDSQKSLLDYRDFLNDVVRELEYATSGDLLRHPTFTRLVKKADETGR